MNPVCTQWQEKPEASSDMTFIQCSIDIIDIEVISVFSDDPDNVTSLVLRVTLSQCQSVRERLTHRERSIEVKLLAV